MAYNGIFLNGLFTCGFDMLTNSSISDILINGVPNSAVGSTNARFADGQALNIGSGNVNGVNLLVNLARFIHGIALYGPVLPATGWQTLMYWTDSVAGTIQLNLSVGTNGQLQFFLGSTHVTTIGSPSANGTIANNRYAYIQTDVTINSSTGIAKAYVDTSGTAAVISATGVNTQSSANAWLNEIFWQAPSAGNGLYLDDFYGLDLTGSSPFNAILGNIHLHWDPAASDAGPNQFNTNPTQTTGNHYKNVDSTTTPSGSAYNYSNTVSQQEEYGFPNITAQTVLAIIGWLYDELDSAGVRTVEQQLISSGVTQNAPSYTPSGTWAYHWFPSTVDPNTTNPWASGTVAAAEAAVLGVEIVT